MENVFNQEFLYCLFRVTKKHHRPHFLLMLQENMTLCYRMTV